MCVCVFLETPFRMVLHVHVVMQMVCLLRKKQSLGFISNGNAIIYIMGLDPTWYVQSGYIYMYVCMYS